MLVTEWDYDLEKEVLQEEAREKERAKIVKSMYENGMSVAQIVKSTNLSEAVIKKILGV